MKTILVTSSGWGPKYYEGKPNSLFTSGLPSARGSATPQSWHSGEGHEVKEFSCALHLDITMCCVEVAFGTVVTAKGGNGQEAMSLFILGAHQESTPPNRHNEFPAEKSHAVPSL